MKPNEFLDQLNDAAVIAAIEAAERTTSGEIRVYVSQLEIEDALARANERFTKLGMHRTRERNAVLLYFAPRSQKFAVIGDAGIHSQCRQAFWDEVVADIRTQLRGQQFTQAVVRAVTKVGQVLARHFPRRDDDRNELPNTIER